MTSDKRIENEIAHGKYLSEEGGRRYLELDLPGRESCVSNGG